MRSKMSASNGAVMNYDFGPKRHWRRWVWNRIHERIVGSAKDALVLYLAGVNDYDRPVAISKGFRHNNLIAVESDKATLKQLRSNGVLTVNANFADVVDSQRGRMPLDVVFGDFCCGLDDNFCQRAQSWFGLAHTTKACFAFNFMRGRDPKSNDVRAINRRSFVYELGEDDKHRGKHFALGAAQLFGGVVVSARYPDVDIDSERFFELMVSASKMVFSSMNPVFNTYMSESGQVFDSVVYTSPMREVISGTWTPKSGLESLPMLIEHFGVSKRGLSTARLSMAAVLAHRTMRVS